MKKERHGDSHKRLYNIWHEMRRRCYSKSKKEYDSYGGRGIGMCDEWRNSYIAFRDWALANGYQDDLTIERMDVNQGYSPSNCTWIPFERQAYNKQNSFFIEYNGVRKTITEWSREVDIHRNTLTHRLTNLHWTVHDALTIRPKGRANKYLVKGVPMTMKQISDTYGQPLQVLWKRIHRYGWTAERAALTPVRSATQ